uniref:Putative nucleotide-binding alpha-beta plait domain, Zinc finger, RING/FYVE/PHD-type n=1 Tax=Helianthus annuus TaxID=4232 RepID=A0A251UEF2_HELAN
MDWTDQQLKPCKCGYEVCVWCWHHIMDMAEKGATEGLCPACRTPYDKSRIVGLKSNIQRVAANNSSRKQKQPKAKQRPNEVKKDLSNVRVIQRRMAYIIGLPISLADEDLLQRKDYFGRYGKVTKVSLSRTAGGTVQQFVNDTCSVYITYSKEEEAVRCIQSVHGYVLDGRFLRASFGTAKYCHAWLRNTPCNNVACLYLHSIGAEEDSFGKDEIAAVHTRNRVQEIVGATEYLHKRSGSTLPSPVDEHSNSRSASAQEPVFSRCQEDVAYAAVASGDHLFCSKDKDGAIKLSKHTTSFVDIVGRSYNSGSDKDTSSSVSEGPMLNICSDMSSVCVNRSNHDNAEGSHLVSPKSSTSKLYSEPFREASRLPSVELDDLTLKDTNITKEQSCLNPVGVVKTYSDDAWWHTESSSRNGYGVNNNANSLLSNGYDRIYGGSKSFFSEEIVEHLRRLDDSSLADDDENSAAVENSIISNILSLDFDGCEDSVLPRTVTGLFEGKDGRHGSSWSFQNSDHSRFSFANEDSVENQDRAYKPHYQAPRVQSVIPPGFSKPPPGFSSGVRSEPVVSASSGMNLCEEFFTEQSLSYAIDREFKQQ